MYSFGARAQTAHRKCPIRRVSEVPQAFWSEVEVGGLNGCGRMMEIQTRCKINMYHMYVEELNYDMILLSLLFM